MVHDFQNRQIIFPVRWANSVAHWIQGLCSPSGTISIRNNLDPQGTGAEIDVNVDILANIIADKLAKKFISYDKLKSVVDGSSITCADGVLSVSADFVRSTAN